MVQIILHTTANLKGSDILCNTQPQTPPPTAMYSPALTSPSSMMDQREQAKHPLASKTQVQNAEGKCAEHNHARGLCNRIPRSHSIVKRPTDYRHRRTTPVMPPYTRLAKTVRTAHYVPTHLGPLVPRPRKSIHVYLAAATRVRVAAGRYAMLSTIPLNTLHHTTLLHLTRALRGAA